MPNGTPQSLPQIASGTPSAPAQTPPSFGQQLLGNKEFSVEFNDSVCDTIAWRSSRYDGNQLETQNGINGAFTSGDKTFGKSSAVEKYTRCIYIGKQVFGHIPDNETIPDTLIKTGFKNKTIVQIEGFFQINSDNTITKITNFDSNNNKRSTKNTIRESIGNDFKLGSRAKLVVFDNSIEQSLKENYLVDFNEGSLNRIAQISQSLSDQGTVLSPMPTFVAPISIGDPSDGNNALVPLFQFAFPETSADGTGDFTSGPNTDGPVVKVFEKTRLSLIKKVISLVSILYSFLTKIFVSFIDVIFSIFLS